MRKYSEIAVQIPESMFDLFLARVSDLAAGRWRRDPALEESSNDIAKCLGVRYVYYVRTDGPTTDVVFVYQKEKLTLTTIITAGGGISPAAHARIAADIWDSGIKQACRELDLKGVHTPSKKVDPAAGLPPGVREALRMFALRVNKSTGSSHPDDRELWCQFLALLHLSGVEFEEHYLSVYLEEKKFPEEVVMKLLQEYDVAMALLPLYDQILAERQPVSVQ